VRRRHVAGVEREPSGVFHRGRGDGAETGTDLLAVAARSQRVPELASHGVRDLEELDTALEVVELEEPLERAPCLLDVRLSDRGRRRDAPRQERSCGEGRRAVASRLRCK
jgi:hypothetical protein